MLLTIPSYPNTHIPTLADHLTRGLLSGLWEGRSFLIINGKNDGMLTESLPFHVTVLKVICIATIIPIFVALVLNWMDQQKPPETPTQLKKKADLPVPQDTAKVEEPEDKTPNGPYTKNLQKINQLPPAWVTFFMTMLKIHKECMQNPAVLTAYHEHQNKYFGHSKDCLKPSDMAALWDALFKNIDDITKDCNFIITKKGVEPYLIKVEPSYLIELVKGK